MDAKELLEKIKEEFRKRFKEKEGFTNYEQVQNYAIEIADKSSKAVISNFDDSLINEFGTLNYDILNEVLSEILESDYKLIADACVTAQTEMNKEANIGLKAIAPKYDDDRAHSIVWDMAQRDLNSFKQAYPTYTDNFYQSTVDEAVRANADFQWKARLEPKIVRIAEPTACKWCKSVEGTYKYEDVKDTGNDVFRRHTDCKCTVTYVLGKGNAKSVWSKQAIDKEQNRKVIDFIATSMDKEKRLEKSTEFSLSKAIMHNSQEANYKLAKNVKPLDGYDDVFIHGDGLSYVIYDLNGKPNNYTAYEIAKFINEYSEFKNPKIRLCSCSAGREPAITAQVMADVTGKEVLAPNRTLWLLEAEGETKMIIAGEINEKIDYNDVGEWITFVPRPRKG